MDITYSYMKKRKTFGRQPLFCEVAPTLLDSILPDLKEQKQYILRNPVDDSTMAGPVQSEHTVNTKRIKIVEKGVNHAEGGWPKDVSYLDEEATNRHRRRVERDDSYVNAVLSTAGKFDHYVKQNNAIEMYEMYFNSMPQQIPVEKTSVTIKNIFVDKEYTRPVASIDWTAEDDTKLVIAYCNKKYPIVKPLNKVYSCLIWTLDNPASPFFTLIPPSACWQIACSPYNPCIIVGGLEDGRVCLFDSLADNKPVAISPAHLAHRDPINSLLFMQTRMNTEFFCGSTDGLCTWWDIRNMEVPLEKMMMIYQLPPMTQPSLAYASPVTSLQFDKSFPTRFLCGTDTGIVINVNRRGKTIQEQMSTVFEAHAGPVRAVQRSPISGKIFITCGDFTVHIWSDDLTTAPIITGTQQRHAVNGVCWAPQRVSAFMTIMANGKFKIYDLLRKYKDPIITLPVSKYSLSCLSCHNEGRLVAVGDVNGATCLLSLSESLVTSGPNDKTMMLGTLEREHHREHILENRIKEIRLKLKLEEETGGVRFDEPDVNEDENCRQAEDAYRKTVAQEFKLMGGAPVSDTRKKAAGTGRKR